eukprot:scaffold166674_cov19-Tisochrysis_lutea.AAC.1
MWPALELMKTYLSVVMGIGVCGTSLCRPVYTLLTTGIMVQALTSACRCTGGSFELHPQIL